MKQSCKPIPTTHCQSLVTNYPLLIFRSYFLLSALAIFRISAAAACRRSRDTKNELKQTLRSGLGKGKISILRNLFPNYKYFDKLKQMK